MPIYTNRAVAALVKTAPVVTTGPEIASGSPMSTSPTTANAIGIPVKLLQAWDKASPALSLPQSPADKRPFFPVPGSEYTANPAAVNTPAELGVNAATLPERNQESAMEQLNDVRRLVGSALGWVPGVDERVLIRKAIDTLQSLLPNLPPDQQDAAKRIISQLQSACSLLNAPFGNPDAYLKEALSALDKLVGHIGPDNYFDPTSVVSWPYLLTFA